jgi:hypothetical protein
LDFQSLDKLPDSNHIQMLFALVPNDPSLISSYPQVVWENVINFNVPTSSKIVEYIALPQPTLKITLEPTSELIPQDITLTLNQYDAINFPINFDGST